MLTLDGQQLVFDSHPVGESQAYGSIHIHGRICPCLDGRVGAATVLIRLRRSVRTLHFCLGPDSDSEYTVQEAKLVGMLYARVMEGM